MTYRIDVWHDPDTESPNAPGTGIGRMVSFNNGHTNYENPNEYSSVDCSDCRGDGGGYTLDEENPEWVECKTCEGYGTVNVPFLDHPDVLAVLSYYEHGSCRWMVGPSTVPDYGGFDTVNVAGLIVWTGEDSEREWWNNRTQQERDETLRVIAEEYTNWCNGETYGYTLERVDHCMECGHEVVELLDSCGGYIGSDYLADAVKETLVDYGVNPEDVSPAGDYGYVLEGELS